MKKEIKVLILKEAEEYLAKERKRQFAERIRNAQALQDFPNQLRIILPTANTSSTNVDNPHERTRQ